MSDKNILAIFDDECKHVKIDAHLLKKIHDYQMAFINRNDDHISFFGGNLLGVHPVRFKKSDSDEWYDEVLDIDDASISTRVKSLPTIDPDWVRGTDVMNLSCLWLVHKICNSTLPQASKEQGMLDTLMVLMCKFLTSLMAHHFKYPADKSVALATYAALTLKYDLKRHGSWYAMLVERCKDIINPHTGIHWNTIKNFNDDGDIQYMVTDIQGRLRELVKNLHGVFETIKTQDAKILTLKNKVDIEGEAVIRDLTRNFTPYRRYVHQVINDKGLFMKPELADIIQTAMYTMPDKLFVRTMEYMVEHYKKDKDDVISEFLDEVMTHAFEFLSEESTLWRHNDLAAIISRLRAVYMSSRSTDPSLMRIRGLAESIVVEATKNKNVSVIASVRTGIMLYVVLRALAMQFYS